MSTPRFASISSKFRSLNGYARYPRTPVRMMSCSKRWPLKSIMRILGCYSLAHGLPTQRTRTNATEPVRVRIHGQMLLAPSSAPARSVLAHRPFALAVDLQAGGIDHHMPGLRTRAASDSHRPFRRPSAERAVVRRVEFGQDFADESRRRAPRRSDQWHLDVPPSSTIERVCCGPALGSERMTSRVIGVPLK